MIIFSGVFFFSFVLKIFFSTMDAKVEILQEEGLPPLPLDLFSCPQHIYGSVMATQALAREGGEGGKECSLHTVTQLGLCRKRMAVSPPPPLRPMSPFVVKF